MRKLSEAGTGSCTQGHITKGKRAIISSALHPIWAYLSLFYLTDLQISLQDTVGASSQSPIPPASGFQKACALQASHDLFSVYLMVDTRG